MHESLNSSRFEQIRVILGAAVEIKKQFDQEEMINKKMGITNIDILHARMGMRLRWRACMRTCA